ncbi:putative invertase inhibitor [Lotus japonicus]|uniref:putative invertase inhibitor n=1 Tax=Lotus japonicus TaxID=34305 RepID=UPI0025826428|nr:putative invertase inhibitor [Lotus japonicus]
MWKQINEVLFTFELVLKTFKLSLLESAPESVHSCKHTLHFKVCVSSLRSVPSSKSSDLKNLSSNYAAKTLSYVCELKSSTDNVTNNNSYMSRCLSDCIEEYKEARENLQDSAEALAEGDYDKVDTLVSAAMSDAETCEDGFKEVFIYDGNKDYSNPSLTKRNSYFSELCSNALAITKLLAQDFCGS